MSFHLGQKIICIDGSPGDVKRYRHLRLVKGETYTVSAIVFQGHLIQVDEFPVPACCFWRANRFRPVRTTSIDIFKAMLVSPQVRADT